MLPNGLMDRAHALSSDFVSDESGRSDTVLNLKQQQKITFLRIESLQARQNFGFHLAGKTVLASLHP